MTTRRAFVTGAATVSAAAMVPVIALFDTEETLTADGLPVYVGGQLAKVGDVSDGKAYVLIPRTAKTGEVIGFHLERAMPWDIK